jgi:hypothetical protein
MNQFYYNIIKIEFVLLHLSKLYNTRRRFVARFYRTNLEMEPIPPQIIGLTCGTNDVRSILSTLRNGCDSIVTEYEHPILRFFNLAESRTLRTVCTEFLDAVEVTPFEDCETRIGRTDTPISLCLERLRQSFPCAIAANVHGRKDLVDADFVHFRGFHTLDISGCTGITDAAFANLRGIRSLNMTSCKQRTITDAAFANLRGICTLIMRGCRQGTISLAAFAHLQGIRTLDIIDCNMGNITFAAVTYLHGIRDLHVEPYRNPIWQAYTQWLRNEIADLAPYIRDNHPLWLFSKDHQGATLLHHAAYEGQPIAVKLLIEYGADVHSSSSDKCTPLHMACIATRNASVSTEIITSLLRAGANINAINCVGNTPLHSTVCQGPSNYQLEVFRLLLDNGASTSARNSRNMTPFMHLCRYGADEYDFRRDIYDLLKSCK